MLAICRAFVPQSRAEEVHDPEKMMGKMVAHTHYLPDHWRERTATYDVHDDFLRLYKYKAVLFLQEVVSVILTPAVLFFSLPRCAEDVVAFVRDFTVHVDGLGHVCGFSLFDFAKYGNPRFGAGSGVEGESAPPAMQSRNGKMEKSFISFQANHPEWRPPADGQQLLTTLSQYRSSALSEDAMAASGTAGSGVAGAAMAGSGLQPSAPPSMAQSGQSHGSATHSGYETASAGGRSAIQTASQATAHSSVSISVGELSASRGAASGVTAATVAEDDSCYYWLNRFSSDYEQRIRAMDRSSGH